MTIRGKETRMRRQIALMGVAFLIVGLVVGFDAKADGAKDNIADKVRPIPPLPTKELSEADRAELHAGVAKLGAEIEALRGSLKNGCFVQILPDVEIYYYAVRSPLV